MNMRLFERTEGGDVHIVKFMCTSISQDKKTSITVNIFLLLQLQDKKQADLRKL